MERLTYKDKDRIDIICKYEDCDICEDRCPCINGDNCPCLQEILEKLAEYEDLEKQQKHSEQVHYLRSLATDQTPEALYEVFDALNEAADTIESLSAKLQATMERTKTDCGSGWIPCSERLPEKNTDCLIRYYNSQEGKYLTDIAWLDEEGHWQLTREKAGYFPFNFKKEITKWMPLPSE